MPNRRPLENILIGTDPECFIFNTKTNKVKSSVKIIPGTKQHPHHIEELGPGFALQTDNILAEFNVPPTDNVKSFVDNITKMKDYIRKFVQGIDENLDVLCAASQNVPKSELRSKQAKQFGCDPDYCIYTGDQNPKPLNAGESNLRSAGFHVHVGYDGPEIDRSLRLLAYMDAYLGLPSILIDKDTQRRTLYGKAGCFRLTDYGCEYRTLSSYFLKDEKHLRWVFNQTIKAISAYNRCDSLPSGDLVQMAINTNDEKLARQLCMDYNLCNDFLEN